jgi:hypothetical protein
MLAVIEAWAYHYCPGQGIGAEFDFLSVRAKLIKHQIVISLHLKQQILAPEKFRHKFLCQYRVDPLLVFRNRVPPGFLISNATGSIPPAEKSLNSVLIFVLRVSERQRSGIR